MGVFFRQQTFKFHQAVVDRRGQRLEIE